MNKEKWMVDHATKMIHKIEMEQKKVGKNCS